MQGPIQGGIMKALAIAVTLMILGALAGCGGSSNANLNGKNLTQAQAQQVATTVSSDVSQALASVLSHTAVPLDIATRDKMRVALQRNGRQASAVAKPEDVTC